MSTGQSLGGLVGLNVLFLVAGLGLLWGLRGWRTWTEVLRLAGVAYLLGAAAVGTLATEVLVAGASVRVPVVLAMSLGLAAGGALLGVGLRRPRPSWRSASTRREPYLYLGLVAAGVAAVALEALLRASAVQGLFEFDAWAFWTTKAKAIYFFGGLDPQLFTHVYNASYPIYIPALEAMDFHFMGAADTTVLHAQFALLLAGFVFAAAGLLRPRVPLAILWPFLALLVLLPRTIGTALSPTGDFALDYFFAAAALCVALWVLHRQPWLLPVAAIFLAAAMSTKREGQLLAAALLVAALFASAREWRRAWVPLVASFALAFCATLPWQLWRSHHHIRGQFQGATFAEMWHNRGRIGPAARSVLELTFSWDAWLVMVPLGLAAAAILLLRGRRRLSSLYLGTLVLGFAGFVWILWAVPDFAVNTSDQDPIVRAAGAFSLLTAALAPLMLEQALRPVARS